MRPLKRWHGLADKEACQCGPRRDDVALLPSLLRRQGRSDLRRNWLVETTGFCLAVGGVGRGETHADGPGKAPQGNTRQHCFG